MIHRRSSSPAGSLILIVFAAIVLQIAVDVIAPLVPYIIAVIVIGGITWAGMAVYKHNRNW